MGKYLVVEILGPPFWNQLLFQLSVDRVSHWNVPSYRDRRTHFANFILASESPSWQTTEGWRERKKKEEK